jgi:FixJ family two-component response regulator
VVRGVLQWKERARRAEIRDRVKALTPREAEVFARVVTGMLNKQIAVELGVVRGDLGDAVIEGTGPRSTIAPRPVL